MRSMSLFRCAVTLLAVLAGELCAAEGNRVKIGSLEVPRDCPLARNERPRLLFRGRDLPKYKARIRGPMKEDFDRFKAYWDRKLSTKNYQAKSGEAMDGVCLGVLYQLTGDRRYADAVRNSTEFKSPARFYQRPFTIDLIFDALTPGEIRQQTDFFLKDAETKFRWGRRQSALWPGIALYGAKTGRKKEVERWLVEGYKAAKGQMATCNLWAEHRGGDYNSFSYCGNHSVIHMGGHLLALSNALGEDAWQQCPWARNLGSYYVYHYPPWRRDAIHFGNTTGGHLGPHHGSLGAGYCLAAAPAQYRDGLQQWWIYNMLVHQNPNLKGWPKVSRENTVMNGLWGRILFYDETLPMREPKDFPPSRLFVYRGTASMRENWSKDATFVHFSAGSQSAYLPDGRQNADANTFTIYKKGILALDTGGQHALDSMRLKLEPRGTHHNYNYAKQTIAHNGVLVIPKSDPGLRQGKARPSIGGQLSKGRPQPWRTARGYKQKENFPLGKTLAWETSPEYDYVVGDATNAYNPAMVKSFTRQLVYVRPNLIFLFDRVEAARDGCRTTWLLHAADKPKTDGTENADKRIHPEGHFLWTGSTVTVTDEEMGGRMFCRMLLPEKREIRLVGGKFHDFELPDGTNIGPTEATYRASGLGTSRALGEGVGGWRIEVEDKTNSRSVRFLHVFQTCDQRTTEMAPCELVRRQDILGANVKTAAGTVEVTFNDKGKVGGHVSITTAAGRTVDRDLAAKIEDHYERWKDHPDYQKWTTDPYRRSVVLGMNP